MTELFAPAAYRPNTRVWAHHESVYYPFVNKLCYSCLCLSLYLPQSGPKGILFNKVQVKVKVKVFSQWYHITRKNFLQVGDTYKFDLFHTERQMCASDFFLEMRAFDFLGDDEQFIDYSVHINEGLDVHGIVETLTVADAFSTGPNYNISIIRG